MYALFRYKEDRLIQIMNVSFRRFKLLGDLSTNDLHEQYDSYQGSSYCWEISVFRWGFFLLVTKEMTANSGTIMFLVNFVHADTLRILLY